MFYLFIFLFIPSIFFGVLRVTASACEEKRRIGSKNIDRPNPSSCCSLVQIHFIYFLRGRNQNFLGAKYPLQVSLSIFVTHPSVVKV